MENEVVDTNVEAAPDTSVTETPNTEATTTAQPTDTDSKLYTIKVNGEEMQLKEPELIKYAQLGRSGQRAMERAALLEKKQKDMYGQLVSAAKKDVFALYEVLTGEKHPYANGQQPQQNGAVQVQEQPDPRDVELQQTKQKLQTIEQRLEAEDVERERKAIDNELSEATKKYPELDSPYLQHFVKSEYRKALQNGLDLSLEDVAFYVAQDVKEREQKKQKAINSSMDENKKRAPVITPPAAKGNGSKSMTLEDVKRLAGRQV